MKNTIKTSKRVLLLLMFGLSLGLAHAQESPTEASGKLGLIVDLGTTPGLELAYKIKPKLTARAGFHYFAYQLNNSIDIGGEQLKLEGDMGMAVPSLSVAFTPAADGFFKLVAGVAYIANGKFTTVFGPEGTYEFEGNTFTAEEIGDIAFSMDYSETVAPFATLGIGRDVPQNRVGIGAEFGTYYLAQPKISLTGTERLEGMAQEQAKIEENTKDWRFWPVVNLRVAIRIN